MRKLILILCLAIATPLAVTSCQSSSQQVIAVQTLKAVGQAAEIAVETSARLYGSRAITAEQARKVNDLYNLKFQPAYRLSVAAVQGNLETLAPEDLAKLASELVSLVRSFQKSSSP